MYSNSRRSLFKLPMFAALALPFFFVDFGAAAAETVDFIDIAHQARFAKAAYLAEAEVHSLAAKEKQELSLYQTLAELQMSFYLLTDDANREQLIAVRGTSNAENAMLDIAFKLLPDEKTGVSLHQGFAFAAGRIYRELKPLLKKDYRVRSTGHSLGGAVAQILAMYLDADGYEVGRIVTFGQPKVTNLPGADRFKHLDILRVVTPTDLVPLVPPFDPLDIRNIEIYWHSGIEVILLDGETYAVLQGTDSMLRAANFTQQLPTEDNLRNHMMDLYLDRIAAKLESPRRVEYRNDLNLFNLFGSGQGG